MTLKYQDKEIELKYSFRASVYFEQISSKNIDFKDFNQNDLVTLFYCVFISSLQKEKLPICSMLDFLDVLDENGGEKCLYDFSNWYVSTLAAQYEFLESTDDGSKKEKKGPAAVKKTN